jgi:hypothetical protein
MRGQKMKVSSMKAFLVVSLAVLGASCGGAPETSDGPQVNTPPSWKNKKPVVVQASPDSLSVGEQLVLLGQDFIEADRGQLVISFKGTYFDDQGASQSVELQQKATLVAPGKVSWKLWPNIVFHPNGDRLGYFLGDLQIINSGKDGSQMTSDPFRTKITVGASLIPRLVQPAGTTCQPLVEKTLEDKGFLMMVEAVGLRPATEESPITFSWSFMAQHWQVSTSYGTMDPSAVFPKEGAVVLEDTITSGTQSSIQDGGSRMFIVKVASDIWGSTSLKELKTGKVPSGAGDFETSVNVAATDATGKTLSLSIPLNVSRIAMLHYDGASSIAERYEPVMVTDCISGGNDVGRQVTYSDDKSETYSRSIGFNYNMGGGVSLSPFPSNPFALGINFNVGFGVDVSGSVSSTKSQGLNISGQILPGLYGVFYRQTTKLYRIGNLVGRNECGQDIDLGEAIVTDYLFTPELATGSTCVPPSKLPKAEKFLN